jgi:PTS system nitrogen regulatory IIA component
LEILSEIAELLSDSQLREAMKTANADAALHQMISTWQSAHAAA